MVWRHALRNALAPASRSSPRTSSTCSAASSSSSTSSPTPGVGKELVDAVAIRDVRAVQSIAMLIATSIVVLNLVADLLVLLLVPRLRTGAR